MSPLVQSGRRALGSVGSLRLKRRGALALGRLSARRVDQIVASKKPVVAGPWVGGVGMELLYWIPFLAHLTSQGLEPGRIVAISRGGADGWYSEVAGRYVDLFDHYSPADIRTWHEERLRRPDTESHIGVHDYDREAFELARELSGERSVEWLHPKLMHRMFAPRWEWGAPGSVVGSRIEQRLLPADGEPSLDLPEAYVVVKGYFNHSLPRSEEATDVLARVISTLAQQTPVLFLRGGDDAGGHEPFVPGPDLPVQDVSERIDPRSNLAFQSAVIRGARALVAPYGGFSALGPFVGTPTLALYSRPGLSPMHLDAIDRASKRLSEGKTRLYKARHIGTLEASAQPEE